MNLKTVKRSAFTEKLRNTPFTKDVLFATGFRATKDGSIQIELAQRRKIGTAKRTLLGVANFSDDRFRGNTTLLFDWLTLSQEDFMQVFEPLTKGTNAITAEDLKAISESWEKTSEAKGDDAVIFPIMKNLPHVIDQETGEKVTPTLIVTEVTEEDILAGKFYRGADWKEKAKDQVDNKYRAMRVSSEDDADYIVDGKTGSIVYRFVRTEFEEDNPEHDLIQDKMTESDYKEMIATKGINPEEALKRELAFDNQDGKM